MIPKNMLKDVPETYYETPTIFKSGEKYVIKQWDEMVDMYGIKKGVDWNDRPLTFIPIPYHFHDYMKHLCGREIDPWHIGDQNGITVAYFTVKHVEINDENGGIWNLPLEAFWLKK